MKFDETKFKKHVWPYLLRCRPGDWEHANRVVGWVKKIVAKDNKKYNLFLIAAYVHDIGWLDLISDNGKKISIDKLFSLEPLANRHTERNVRKLIKDICKEEEIIFILKLIDAADKHKAEDGEEAIMVDSDNLSKLCKEHVQEKFNNESWKEIYELWEREFPNRMRTRLGKDIYLELLSKLKKDLELE